MRHLEAFCDDALAYLQANLPTRIAALNAETTDFDLVVPVAYWFGGPPSLAVSDYPSIEVAAPDIALQNPSLSQLHWDSRPRVMVRLFHQDTNFEQFTRALYRYGRCIVETMTQPGAFGGHEAIENLSTHYAVNPETNERAEFTGGVLCVFNLDSTEARP
jgi:hypothetical protein